MSNSSTGPGGWFLGVIGVVVGVFVVIAALAWVFSFRGTDSGEICVVREGGPFDGRAIKEVRQPGEGPKPIGAFNHQECLPTTERDSNDVIEGDPAFPTKDSVQVVADGQTLFALTTDADKIKTFYKKYGRRKWGGENISDEKGWLNFLQQRVAPVILDAQREVIGQYDCVALNNLCVYVQNPEAAVETKAGNNKPSVNNTQNLSEAQRTLAAKIKEKLRAAFGDDYFENVRYQNLRIRFEQGVNERIIEAQSLRTQAVNARLNAEKKKAEAQGDAARRVEVAKGEAEAAKEQERAYRLNPTKRSIDRIKAFCGEDGCDPQVIGNVGSTISSLGQRGGQ